MRSPDVHNAEGPQGCGSGQTVHVEYGDRTLVCQLVENSKLRHKVKIHVYPGGEIHVDIPPGQSLINVKQAIRQRSRWICQQLDNIAVRRSLATPRQYVSGESHYYIGRRYMLKLIDSEDESVKLKAGQLQIRTIDRSASRISVLLKDWYRHRARIVFQRRINAIADGLDWVTDDPVIRLRSMKGRWGSCAPSGNIVLNPSLVKAPVFCIDVVILHELCHLKINNHSPAFYRLMGAHMPNWRTHKLRLDEMVDLLVQ